MNKTSSAKSSVLLGIDFMSLSYMHNLQLACSKQSRSAEIHAFGLIREPSVDTERRVYIAGDALLLVNFLQLLHVLVIEGDELLVLVDAGWGYGFCEDGGVAGDCVVS